MRIAVIGAGAWGTALADLLARNGEEVRLWARESDVVASIDDRHVNERFLEGFTLAPSLRAYGDLAEALADAELAVIATPSQVLRSVIRRCATTFSSSAVIVVASKGIERDSLCVMTDVAAAELPGRPMVALSGPSFAAEVAARQPTAIVAASSDAAAAELVQRVCSSPTFRVYTQADVIGVELGGALKNVIAIAAGAAEGLGFGNNARAGLITRGIAEIARLAVHMGAHPQTLAGLSGLGDLVLTCTGDLSRNRRVGLELGRGRSLPEVLADMTMVAEGVKTAASAHALADREGVEMPITTEVYRALYEGKAPAAAVESLLTRALRPERD